MYEPLGGRQSNMSELEAEIDIYDDDELLFGDEELSDTQESSLYNEVRFIFLVAIGLVYHFRLPPSILVVSRLLLWRCIFLGFLLCAVVMSRLQCLSCSR